MSLIQKRAKIINIIGGPGAGKTTVAAGVFELLKKNHLVVEYVQEYAKKLVWLRDFDTLNNQYHVSMKQYRLFKMMSESVDYIVTDGPLFHGLHYNQANDENTSNRDKTEKKILELISEFDNINIFIERGDFEYETAGRMQSYQESKYIDYQLLRLMAKHDMKYVTFGPNDKEAIAKYIHS